MTTTEEYTPFGDRPPTRELTELRLRAEQLVRAEDHEALLALVDQLREDDDWWPHLWGPAAAVAASKVGRSDGLELLSSAIDAGFSQPELMEGELEACFAESAQWPDLVERMAANIPAPRLRLLDWPVATVALPLELYQIAPERSEKLRAALPEPEQSAWGTARALLTWVHTRWEHANDHVEDPDALDVLARVDAGEKFACVEYSIVLSQALNAAGIPGRRLDLRQANHHVGVGRGHVVSEGWIDDLDRWVVLDGQNGAYWTDDDGDPLGALELQRRLAAGESATMVGLVEPMSASESATWFSYFATMSTTGCVWAPAGFAPIFQGMAVVRSTRLVHDGAAAYPALSDLTIGTGGTLDRPVIRLASAHPYVRDYRASEAGREPTDFGDDGWPLSMDPGRHEVALCAVTAFGALQPRALVYEVVDG